MAGQPGPHDWLERRAVGCCPFLPFDRKLLLVFDSVWLGLQMSNYFILSAWELALFSFAFDSIWPFIWFGRSLWDEGLLGSDPTLCNVGSTVRRCSRGSSTLLMAVGAMRVLLWWWWRLPNMRSHREWVTSSLFCVTNSVLRTCKRLWVKKICCMSVRVYG